MTAEKTEEYERPQITCYGDLTELTAGTSFGNKFDGNFNTGDDALNFLSCVPGRIPCFQVP